MQKLSGFFAALLMLLGTVTLSAQNLSISGRVVDASGQPLIAVTVFEDGNTTNGTMTDIDGNYTLNVSSGTYYITHSRACQPFFVNKNNFGGMAILNVNNV